MSTNFKAVLKVIKSIRASVDSISVLVLPDHPLYEKVTKLKLAVESDEDITSDGTVLAIRKLIESCRHHFQFKPAFKLCSDFCHDQPVPREPTLTEIQVLVAYLTIMIAEAAPQSKSEVEPSSDANDNNLRPASPTRDVNWPGLPPKRLPSPKPEDNIKSTSNNSNSTSINTVLNNLNTININEDKNGNTNSKPTSKTAPSKITRQVKYPHIRCKHYQLTNNCQMGIQCHFVHDDSEFVDNGCLKRSICREWKEGTCPFSKCPEKCAFAHGYQDLRFNN